MKPARFVFVFVLVAACSKDADAPRHERQRPSSNRAETSAPAASQVPLPGVDVARLSDSEKRDFYRIVEQVSSPCGEAMSIARCVREGGSCSGCRKAARYLVRLLETGYPADAARELVKLRYASDTRVEVSTEGCVFQGSAMARVTFVEFADFECPHCKLAHEMFHQLFADTSFASSVRLCYRFFPLNGHANARPAARAAVAAMNQGKFWPMHDLLYEHQAELSPAIFGRFADQLGLDRARFQADFDAPASDARVQRDRDEGERLEIEGTPAFFVNGRRYEESLDPESVRAYVREELDP